MRRTGLAFLTLFWLLVGGLVWWGFAHYLNPNARLTEAAVAGGEIVLKRGPDGHYRAPGRINGQPVDFLVDTGATVVALPGPLAARLGLARGATLRVHTANGDAIAYATRLDQVSLGGAAAERVTAHIVPGMRGDEALLGMSFLSRFDIAMSGDEMRLRLLPGD
ncbi:MAG: retropepsin-like aspartic protease family protein [Pseudomonadota bacterium]